MKMVIQVPSEYLEVLALNPIMFNKLSDDLNAFMNNPEDTFIILPSDEGWSTRYEGTGTFNTWEITNAEDIPVCVSQGSSMVSITNEVLNINEDLLGKEK